MTTVLIVFVSILVVSLGIQFVLVAGFVSRLNRWQQPLLADPQCPPAVVVLCLRGGDPFLEKCLDGLMTMDYPNYEVRFVVDHSQDPAMKLLNESIAKHSFDRFKILVLEKPLSTCSLKCSSLVQALSEIDGSTVFIAQLDADTIPHKTWLRELATALAPDDVGAATGNRWYMPDELSQGALVRHIWNAAAIVQMYWYQIAWGGTLAIKLETIRRAKLVERWSLALCEDTMLKQQLSSIGQQVRFVPSLMMINREGCSVDTFYRWVKRQLLTARLYHPLWLAVVGHGISSALMLLWGGVMGLALIIRGDWALGFSVFVSMLVFQSCLSMMLPWMESSVGAIAKARGEDTRWKQELGWSSLLWAICTTQWIYTSALIECLWMKRVDWRGIEYTISGPWGISMLGYVPYEESTQPSTAGQQSL